MLLNIDPLLSGDLLRILDHMGHGDAIVVADANFAAHSHADTVIDVHAPSPAVLAAIRSVVPVDEYEGPSVLLMAAEPGLGVEVQRELRAAAACAPERIDELERHTFYAAARATVAVVRTAEARAYGNVILRKGVVQAQGEPEGATR